MCDCMNKISIKLATYFIVTVLIMESMLMLYLHQTIVHTRIDEEISQLVSKGSDHRDVLEKNYSDDTMRHIVLMESDSKRRVVITDKEFNLIIGSDSYSSNLKAIVNRISSQKPNKDQVIQSNWKDEDFIASLHPFQVNGEHAGYVILFQSTETIQFLVNKLNFHFILAGFASLTFLCVGILSFLSF